MVIDDKAKISLFAVLAATPVVVGGIIWLTNIDNRAAAAQVEARGLRELVIDVRERLIRIEERMKNK